MGIHDPDQNNELEVQISRLRRPAAGEPAGESVEANPLLATARPRQAQRRRALVVTATLALVLVALVLSIAPMREALRGIVFGPTPSATTSLRGEDNVYIALSPNWGTVSLDDKPLTRLPVEGVDQPLRVSRGVHVLRWRFDPIINTACAFTLPFAPGDTCLMRVGILPHKKGIASVVTLQLSLADVSPTYYHSLMRVILAALDAQQSSAIVRPGERYYTGVSPSGGVVAAVARQPLRATLRFVSDLEDFREGCSRIVSGPGVNCEMNGNCRMLCTAPWQTPSATINGMWQAYIVAHATWRITTLDGRTIQPDLVDVGGTNRPSNDAHPLPIAIGWDGSRWEVSARFATSSAADPFSAPGCLSARDAVTFQIILPPELPGHAGGGVGVSWQYVQGSPMAAGCLAAALPLNARGAPDASPQGIAVAGLILYRFGVPLAANAAAHRYWPNLPVADTYEQALAQDLAQKLPNAEGTTQGG